MLAQDQAQPLAPDPDLPVVTVSAQVGGEFPHTPVRERDAQRARSSGGRRDDECDVGVTDLAGRPPVHRGSSAANPRWLNAWMTSRTVSSSAATNRAIADTGVPDADAMMIVARRTRTELPRPRRTIWVSVWPS